MHNQREDIGKGGVVKVPGAPKFHPKLKGLFAIEDEDGWRAFDLITSDDLDCDICVNFNTEGDITGAEFYGGYHGICNPLEKLIRFLDKVKIMYPEAFETWL